MANHLETASSNEAQGIADRDDLASGPHGFLDLPSLFVFFDPFSSNEAVRNFLLSGSVAWDAAKALGRKLDTTARSDLVLRLSVLGHEIQHFLDLVGTPFGALLLREHLKLGVLAGLFFGRVEAGTKGRKIIKVPLEAQRFSDPDAVTQILRQAARCSELKNACRWTLETSAVLTQRVATYDIFDEKELAALDEVLVKAPDYYQMNTLLDWVAERWRTGDGNWFKVARQLMYLALCFPEPDRAFLAVLSPLLSTFEQSDSAAWHAEILDPVMRSWKALVEGAHRDDQQENARFLNHVIPNELQAPPWLQDFVREVFSEYMRRSYAVRERWIGQPDSFFDPHDSERDVLPIPRVYVYPNDPRYARFAPGLEPKPDDLEEFELHADKGAPTFVVPRVMAGSGASGNRHFNAEWIDVAKTLSGPIALTRRLNWRHPISGFWMRTMTESGFQFEG